MIKMFIVMKKAHIPANSQNMSQYASTSPTLIAIGHPGPVVYADKQRALEICRKANNCNPGGYFGVIDIENKKVIDI